MCLRLIKGGFMLDKIKELVKEKDTCVLATVGQGCPHCSLMAYIADDDCREIYMVTLKDTRKYRNLMENPLVSLLIDTRADHSGPQRRAAKALTVAGTLLKIEDPNQYGSLREKLLDRHPQLKEFLDQPEAAILCIKISSFLLLDGLSDAYFEEV